MIQLAAEPGGLAERGFSADLGLPAFPLNFDPQELLADVDAGSDPQLNLQEMLELDLEGSPRIQEAVQNNVAASDLNETGAHGSKSLTHNPSSLPVASQQHTTPGVYELFQLQHVVPSNTYTQSVQWNLQPMPQQQVAQPAASLPLGSQMVPQTVYQQPEQQQLPPQQQMFQPQQQYMTSAQTPYQQVTFLSSNGMQQQQAVLLQQPQAGGYVLGSGASQQAMYASTNQQFVAPQPLYIPMPQLQPQANVAGPFMFSPSYPADAAVLSPDGLLPSSAVTAAGLPSYDSFIEQQTGIPVGSAHSFNTSNKSSVAAAGSAGAAVAAARKSRSKAATAVVAPGTEKPKGPSRRFRERQKETISNLEAEVTEKLAQLQALSAENEMLKLRSAVLEATVKGREYHMRIIKEHGPPVFDAAEARAVDMLTQLSNGTGTDSPAASHSGLSAGSGLRATKSFSDSEIDGAGCTTDGETATTAVAAGLWHNNSGISNTGTVPDSSPTQHTEPPLATVVSTSKAEAESLKCCDAPQMCSPAQQKKTISVLKHMSTEEIIQHWKQFLHDVTGELLNAEQEEQQEKLRKLAQFGRDDAEDDSTCTSAHEHVGKTCRWCSGCDESIEHSEENCRAAAEQRAAEQQKATSCAEGPNDGACCDVKPVNGSAGCGTQQQAASDCLSGQQCTPSENRIVAMVNKYSYMTKFVALLNPGVLYHLFGLHLDTGLPAPYTDDHWRQVVSRLDLSKHQVTVILACAELYFSSLGKVLEQRRVLQQQLKQADEGLSECQKRLRGVDGTINQLQVLDALASNLKREHVLRIMLNCFVWGRSLNSIQFAKSAVYSHPFFPDVHAMVCVLYEDARAMAPNGQPALVFPHRQHKQDSASQQQQQEAEESRVQQQEQLQALHEQLRAQSEELRLQAIQQQQLSSVSQGMVV